VKDLLVLLGKRVHDLRAAKKWSQEEFAHVSGLHRTYIGQIERGEKNISFGNLVKVSNALGVTMAELLAELEAGGPGGPERPLDPGDRKGRNSPGRILDLQKLLTRLRVQRTAMDRTMASLEKLMAVTSTGSRLKQPRPSKK
jgi:transcriptional regulator with XRE-family HTH domain